MSSTHTILTTPAPGTSIKPVYEYTQEQKDQIVALRQASSLACVTFCIYPICANHQKYADTVMLPPTDDYHPWELRWLNKPDTISRYMRASKWNLRDAETRLKATLEWRREYKPDLIPPDEVKIEGETGKM